MVCEVGLLDLGRKSYASALKIQNGIATFFKRVNNSGRDLAGSVILVEHPPVYTIGIRTKGYSLEDETRLKSLGAEFFKTNRGGLITFHGPGQLVAYPILNLKYFRPSMQWYIATLEDTVIDVCSSFGLRAEKSPHTGVWVDDKKICAIGVHGSRYVTSHGLALNCNTELSWFSHIVPCGIPGKGVTSLTDRLGREVTIRDALPLFLDSFSRHFSSRLVNLETDYFDVGGTSECARS